MISYCSAGSGMPTRSSFQPWGTNTPNLTVIILLLISLHRLIGRQPIAVGRDQVVDQRPDLIEAQLGGGVRVEHRGVVDMLTLAGQRGLDGQRLYVDVSLHQRGQVRRQRADLGRL